MNAASQRHTSRRGLLGLGAGFAALAAVGAAACGAPQGGAAGVPAAGKYERGTKVDLLDQGPLWDQGPLATRFKPLLTQWQDKTALQLHVVENDKTTAEKLQVLLSAGTPPDMTSVGGTRDALSVLLVTGSVVALDPLMKRDKLDTSDYYPYSLEHLRWKNAQWGLPTQMTPPVMFHNRDLFTRNGAQPPPASWKAANWTWADLLATGRTLSKISGDPATDVFGTAMVDNSKTPAIAVWSHGGDLFDKDFTKCTLDSPQAVEGLQTLVDLAQKYHVGPTPADLQANNAPRLFYGGRAGILASGQNLNFINTIAQQKVGFPWGVNVFPKGPGGRATVTLAQGLAILKSGHSTEAAWEFLTFMQTPEVLRLTGQDGSNGIVPRRSVMADILKAPDAQFPPGYAEIVDLGDSARRWPLLRHWPEILDVLTKHLGRLWGGTVSVREITSDIVTEVNPLLKDRL